MKPNAQPNGLEYNCVIENSGGKTPMVCECKIEIFSGLEYVHNCLIIRRGILIYGVHKTVIINTALIIHMFVHKHHPPIRILG